MNKSVLCLMGPTASGKTDLAIRLSDHFPLELISVDSVMVYKGMDIGTAKPPAALLKQYPHHLIDILTPEESYSAGRFVEEVLPIIEECFQKGRTPLLVGGTMLYFHALQSGLAALPESSPQVRAQIEAEAKKHGWSYMHAQLAEVDAESASKIRPEDPQRITRALEVYAMTKQPLSLLQKQNQRKNESYEWTNLILYPPSRAWLHRCIEQRFTQMVHNGLIDEVASLLKQYPACEHAPSMRAVGYRQALAYLKGELSYHDFENRGTVATRQLAKRQCTWLKSWPKATWYDPQDPTLFEQVKMRLMHEKETSKHK